MEICESMRCRALQAISVVSSEPLNSPSGPVSSPPMLYASTSKCLRDVCRILVRNCTTHLIASAPTDNVKAVVIKTHTNRILTPD
eukprot:3317313-Karenia_brevis.AAC.1